MRIMFVCTGNICRSPTAEAVAKKLLQHSEFKDQIKVESSGLQGHHVGEKPDERTIAVGEKRGLTFDSVAQLFKESCFHEMDWIVAMDKGHYQRLMSITRGRRVRAKVVEMIHFCQLIKESLLEGIPDPYYGTERDFETVLNLLEVGVKNFLENEVFPRLKPVPDES